MCGIAGIVSPSPLAPGQVAAVRRMRAGCCTAARTVAASTWPRTPHRHAAALHH
jgi:hypothetical protein